MPRDRPARGDARRDARGEAGSSPRPEPPAAATVRASQRERLLRSVIAAVSECGYQAVTVADIVRRARVSKKAFYEHFANKEQCFLAATGEGRELMIAQVVSATRALPAGSRAGGETPRLRAGPTLSSLAGELPSRPSSTSTCRPRVCSALARLGCRGAYRFAELNARWHHCAREHYPDCLSVPPEAYLALSGAID